MKQKSSSCKVDIDNGHNWYGWFRVFTIPYSWGMNYMSFDITILRRYTYTNPMAYKLQCIKRSNTSGAFVLLNRVDLSGSIDHAQVLKIRMMRDTSVANGNMYIDVFIGRPDGGSITASEDEIYTISISNLIAAEGCSQDVFSSIITRYYSNPVIVSEAPTNENHIGNDFDLYSGRYLENSVLVSNTWTLNDYSRGLCHIIATHPFSNDASSFVVRIKQTASYACGPILCLSRYNSFLLYIGSGLSNSANIITYRKFLLGNEGPDTEPGGYSMVVHPEANNNYVDIKIARGWDTIVFLGLCTTSWEFSKVDYY